MSTDDDKRPNRRHGWRRLGLRALQTVAVVAVLFGLWQVVKVKRIRDQHEAVDAVELQGGEVRYRNYFSGHMPPHMPKWLWYRVTDQSPCDVVWVVVEGDDVTDRWLARLRRLPKLQVLGLLKTQVTDSGLAGLSRWPHLESLWLNGSGVTDAGMVHVEQLTKLNSLYLENTPIGDAGLAHLKSLSQLEYLSLRGTRVTDTGLEHLKGLTRLKWINLDGTQVTLDGKKNLQRAIPSAADGGI